MRDRDDSRPASCLGLPDCPPDRLRLEAGGLRVEIAPKYGSSFTRFYLSADGRCIDLFRQADEAAIEGRLPLGASCFPLLPYAGRLRGGTFLHRSHQISFPLNALPEPHSSHGDGWTRPWRVTRQSRRLAVLTLEAAADPPFRYRCRQTITLSDAGLRIRMRLWNDEAVAMPIGIGLHPYFPRRGDPILTADLPQRWLVDRELMPVEIQPNEHAGQIAIGAAISSLPEHCEYWGWDGVARLDWPAEGVKLDIRTVPGLQAAVLWAPHGEDFFCFEPISHATDAFNCDEHGASNFGVMVLEPGAQLKQDFYFDVISNLPDVRTDEPQ